MVHCSNCGSPIPRQDGEDLCPLCLVAQGDRKQLDRLRRRMRKQAVRNAVGVITGKFLTPVTYNDPELRL